VTTVVVLYVIAGTVTEETLTAERITTQMLRRGRTSIRLFNGGVRTRAITYERVIRMDQSYDRAAGAQPEGGVCTCAGAFTDTQCPVHQGKTWAHDAHCNTVHPAGPEPCPPPREERV
jgi:hypothetical protein